MKFGSELGATVIGFEGKRDFHFKDVRVVLRNQLKIAVDYHAELRHIILHQTDTVNTSSYPGT